MLNFMQMQLTHLQIFAMKAMLGHVERITQRQHDSTIQIRFELNSVKGVQVIALLVWNKAVSKNAVQLFRAPLVSSVQIQLFCQILGYPLHQLEWLNLHKGVVLAVNMLESLFTSLVL